MSNTLGAISLLLLGSLIGSVLNCCIDRWPRHNSPFHTEQATARQWIPFILIWALIKWNAEGSSIPKRYFVTEILTGIVAVLTYQWIPSLAIPYFVLFCILWVATCTDLETWIISDACTLTGIALGVMLSACYPSLHWTSDRIASVVLSLQGMCWGTGGLFLMASFIEWFMRKDAMGLGDVKLIGCIGAFLGWEGCVWSLFVGSLLGTFFVCLRTLYPKNNQPQLLILKHAIPFGPHLAVAALLFIPYQHFVLMGLS